MINKLIKSNNRQIFSIFFFVLIFILGIIIGNLYQTNVKTPMNNVQVHNKQDQQTPDKQEIDELNKNIVNQLIERVKDSCNHLDVFIGIITLIITFITGVLGYNLFKTRELIKEEAERQFSIYKNEQIDPFLQSSSELIVKEVKSQFDTFRNQQLEPIFENSLVNTKKYANMYQSISRILDYANLINFEIAIDLEEKSLQIKELDDNQVNEKVKQKKKELTYKRLLINYTIGLFSPNEEDVINAAQQLGELKNTEALIPLHEALNYWSSNSTAYYEIKRSIDNLQSLKNV